MKTNSRLIRGMQPAFGSASLRALVVVTLLNNILGLRLNRRALQQRGPNE
jgi:hypothetical protein